MNHLEIYINGVPADLGENLKVVLDKVVSEFRNPLKKTGSYSYTIKFPDTLHNKQLFHFQNDRGVIGKFRKFYGCEVYCNGELILSGEFKLESPSRGFEGNIYGTRGGRISGIIDDTKKLKDIASFTPINFEGDKTVWEYLDSDLYANESEIAFPFLVNSFAKLKSVAGGTEDGVKQTLGYESFGVSHFTKAVFRNIFTDAGYALEGTVLDTEAFKRMLLLYTSAEESRAYNYGALNLTNAALTAGIPKPSGGRPPRYGPYMPLKVLDGVDYNLYVVHPEVKAKEGDQSFSLGPTGIYTCNYTSQYTFDIQLKSYAYHYSNTAGYAAVQTKQVLLFRDVTDVEWLDDDNADLPEDYADLSFANLADLDTYNAADNTASTVSGTTHTHRIQMTVKLKEGRRYRPQLYVGVLKTALPDPLMIAADPVADNWYRITSVQGRTQLDPAKFLPDMTQLEFVNAIFKLFNLFYQIDELNKVVTVYTRDEFFAQSRENILDLSGYLNLDDFRETPLTQEEIDETYFRWSGDDTDYLLASTPYMDKVNGGVSEGVYELPFAPLAFLQVQVDKFSNGSLIASGNELLPAALPVIDTTDSSVLDDFTIQTDFNYKPKLALYYGAGFLGEGTYRINYGEPTSATQPENFCLVFERTAGLTGGFAANADGSLRYKHIPKLGFFNAAEQPAYEVELLPATREFQLNERTGNTIYSNPSAGFIPVLLTEKLDALSLALEGWKSVPQSLYLNDLLITDWSNFTEGLIKMDPLLYNRLNGRNILCIDDDLYLLESVKSYDPTGNTAKIKLYKMVSN